MKGEKTGLSSEESGAFLGRLPDVVLYAEKR